MADPTTSDLTADLATALRSARAGHELSVQALADRSGVSRAMIGKIERGEAQPTAALLGRLTAALGITLSELFARAEGPPPRLVRAADQRVWTDPATGYHRRSVSPDGGAIQLVDVELPPGAAVSYPADAFRFVHHQIWVLAGHLLFDEGGTEHHLHPGDCLELGPPAPCTYRNPTTQPCRYLVVLTRHSTTRP